MRIVVILAMLLTACGTTASPADVQGTVEASVRATLQAQPVAATALPAGLLQPLEEGRITLTVADIYPLAQSPAQQRELDDATRRGDDGPVQRALAAGSIYIVSDGTRVRVLGYDGNLVQVNVLDGPEQGKTGWLPINLVGR